MLSIHQVIKGTSRGWRLAEIVALPAAGSPLESVGADRARELWPSMSWLALELGAISLHRAIFHRFLMHLHYRKIQYKING